MFINLWFLRCQFRDVFFLPFSRKTTSLYPIRNFFKIIEQDCRIGNPITSSLPQGHWLNKHYTENSLCEKSRNELSEFCTQCFSQTCWKVCSNHLPSSPPLTQYGDIGRKFPAPSLSLGMEIEDWTTCSMFWHFGGLPKQMAFLSSKFNCWQERAPSRGTTEIKDECLYLLQIIFQSSSTQLCTDLWEKSPNSQLLPRKKEL